MWHEDCTRRPHHGCPVGHLLQSCSQGQEAPPRNHTGRTTFSKCQGPGQHQLPPGSSSAHPGHWAFRHFQRDFQKTSSTGAMTACSAFVGVQNGTTRVEVDTAWLTHWPKIITRPYLRPSPQAAPFQTGSTLQGCITGGLSTRVVDLLAVHC